MKPLDSETIEKRLALLQSRNRKLQEETNALLDQNRQTLSGLETPLKETRDQRHKLGTNY